MNRPRCSLCAQNESAESNLPESSVVAGLRADGYINLAEHVYPSGRRLYVGARVRHVGEQYPEAFRSGTGTVVALLHKPRSGWSQSHGQPDIELVMLRDRPRSDTRLSQVAHYHVEVIEAAGDDD